MPEVPNAQAPSVEEVKLSSDPQPQPSEATLDAQTAEQKPTSVPPSEGGNVVPVEPVEGLTTTSEKPEYKEGDSFSFVAPNGESYTILVTKVEGDQVTLQNSTPDAAPTTVSLKQAKEILESPSRVWEMGSYTKIAQNQLEAIALIQNELLSRLKNGRIGSNASELTAYLNLIERAIPLLNVLPDDTAEQLANTQVNRLLELILNNQQGDLSMPIDPARYDAAVAELNKLKSETADDEANRAALAQAQADLRAAQDAVAPLQAKVDQLTVEAADDESNRAALAQAQADLKAAQDALAAAEQKTNQLIDQILPPEVPVEPVE